MKKMLFVLMPAIVFSGCVTVSHGGRGPGQGIATGDNVRLGMAIKEVMALMGDEVVIGYRPADNKSGTFVPVVIKQPYRQETLHAGKKTYRVLYYFSEIKHADNKVTNDELMPYIFEYGGFFGRGWDLLKDIMTKGKEGE